MMKFSLLLLALIAITQACKDKYSNCPTSLKVYCTSTVHTFVKTDWCQLTCGHCTSAPTPPPPAYVSAEPKITQSEMEKIGETCLAAHNKKRGLHENTPLMTYDMDLAKRAQAFAEYLLENKKWEHDAFRRHGYNGGVGENLYKSSSQLPSSGNAVNAWYQEINNYNFETGTSPNDGVIGHFTQLVWDSSTKLGCGVAKSQSGGTYVVSRYIPAGNGGQYTQHVHALKPNAVSDEEAVM